MTPDQTTKLRAVLDALKKIQAERTQGDWAADLMGTWVTAADGQMRVCDLRGWGYFTAVLKMSDDQAIKMQESNARAIVASVNLDLAGIEAMEGLLNLPCHAQYQTHAMGPCVWCQDKLKILSAYLTRATAVLEGLGVGL